MQEKDILRKISSSSAPRALRMSKVKELSVFSEFRNSKDIWSRIQITKFEKR
jgi:hypothetical protein